ncbi:hypothetical protein AYI69_g2385 [Smittium culicis]|uniref:PIN domain-containing protein n=1 Tax=Smittium culicis TaxID=133412 RepID=A0A1R1YN34_9FUNG|nr:hypothetical protein AYI69_g2385 [Smittium culicis]
MSSKRINSSDLIAIVVDTNYFLHSFLFLKSLFTEIMIHDLLEFQIVVPFVVIGELDRIHKRTKNRRPRPPKNSSKSYKRSLVDHSDDKGLHFKAKDAISFLNHNSGNKFLRGQKIDETLLKSNLNTVPDDLILDCCRYFMVCEKKKVALLTYDNNLTLKAKINQVQPIGVHGDSIDSFLSKLRHLHPLDTHSINLAKNNPNYNSNNHHEKNSGPNLKRKVSSEIISLLEDSDEDTTLMPQNISSSSKSHHNNLTKKVKLFNPGTAPFSLDNNRSSFNKMYIPTLKNINSSAHSSNNYNTSYNSNNHNFTNSKLPSNISIPDTDYIPFNELLNSKQSKTLVNVHFKNLNSSLKPKIPSDVSTKKYSDLSDNNSHFDFDIDDYLSTNQLFKSKATDLSPKISSQNLSSDTVEQTNPIKLYLNNNRSKFLSSEISNSSSNSELIANSNTHNKLLLNEPTAQKFSDDNPLNKFAAPLAYSSDSDLESSNITQPTNNHIKPQKNLPKTHFSSSKLTGNRRQSSKDSVTFPNDTELIVISD